MEIDKAKETSVENASKAVASYLTRPEHLDKVEQNRRRIMRNKASVDTRLKTAVQSQVDGIRSGLQELRNAQQDITSIKEIITQVNDIFNECKPLSTKLDQVLVAHNKQAKLSKTNTHLKQIFNVPETIAKTKELINESKFLEAHKNIIELEVTRDDLLFELHKLAQNDSTHPMEESPIFAYFEQVAELSRQLWKQLATVIDRTLGAARSKPTQIVTALRIVEREERSDKRCLEQEKSTGFLPPGRPKNFKKLTLEGIERSVQNRFDGNQLELEDKTVKMWLVRHLERMRKLILDDLLIVKHLVKPCFPPTYDIFKYYTLLYHRGTSKTLEDFALNQTNPDECVMLLAWTNEYYGSELLGHEDLKPSVDLFRTELQPEKLISEHVLDSLMDTYVSTTEKNMVTWLEKMGQSESQDWMQDKPPETDGEGFFQTSLPIILFQMLDQNLQVGAHIKQDVKMKVVDVCVQSLDRFVVAFKELIVQFKDKCFANRESTQYFEPYMVAIANNCLSIADFTETMMSKMKADLGEETFGLVRIASFSATENSYKNLCNEVCQLLLDGAFLDLDVFFQDLISRKWLASSTIVDTIIVTIEDYANDYLHLKESAFEYIMKKAEMRIAVEFVQACMQRRITFRPGFEERRQAADQITEEATKINSTFTRLANLPALPKSPCYVLVKIAEVLKVKEAKDPVVITLELSGLASENQDFQMDHAIALLALRGDMGRAECRQTVTQITFQLFDVTSQNDEMVFAQVTVASSMLDKIESKIGHHKE